jgi:hypothetical protein
MQISVRYYSYQSAWRHCLAVRSVPRACREPGASMTLACREAFPNVPLHECLQVRPCHGITKAASNGASSWKREPADRSGRFALCSDIVDFVKKKSEIWFPSLLKYSLPPPPPSIGILRNGGMLSRQCLVDSPPPFFS